MSIYGDPITLGGGSAPTPEPGLPAGYAEVEYLVCSGAEWINTDLPVYMGDILTFTAKTTSSSSQTIVGNRESASTRWDAGYENGAYYAMNACAKIWSNVTDGVWKAALVVTSATSTGFCYGAYKYSTRAPFYGRLHTLRVYRPVGADMDRLDYSLVARFIPCRRTADSVLGFYDAVNEVFYTNAGGGAFTAGPDV